MMERGEWRTGDLPSRPRRSSYTAPSTIGPVTPGHEAQPSRRLAPGSGSMPAGMPLAVDEEMQTPIPMQIRQLQSQVPAGVRRAIGGDVLEKETGLPGAAVELHLSGARVDGGQVQSSITVPVDDVMAHVEVLGDDLRPGFALLARARR